MKIDQKVKAKAAKEWMRWAGKKSKAQVAKEFGVSVRTLGREIEKLQGTGVTPPKVEKAKPEKAAAIKYPEAPVSPKEKEEPQAFQYSGTVDSVTISDGKTAAFIPRDDKRYDNVVKYILSGDLQKAWELANIRISINKFTNGIVTVEDGCVWVHGITVKNDMTDRILEMMGSTDDTKEVAKFVNFFEKLMDHHDKRVIDELFPFLAHCSIELNEDGSFNAYRSVRKDFTDKHSGKFDNSVGKVVVMPRSMVNDNKHETCSAGLHFASRSYAESTYGDRGDQLIKVKIWPNDVVSIPIDYDGQKGRCCKFEVIEHIKTI